MPGTVSPQIGVEISHRGTIHVVCLFLPLAVEGRDKVLACITDHAPLNHACMIQKRPDPCWTPPEKWYSTLSNKFIFLFLPQVRSLWFIQKRVSFPVNSMGQVYRLQLRIMELFRKSGTRNLTSKTIRSGVAPIFICNPKDRGQFKKNFFKINECIGC